MANEHGAHSKDDEQNESSIQGLAHGRATGIVAGNRSKLGGAAAGPFHARTGAGATFIGGWRGSRTDPPVLIAALRRHP
jgi:hypothetical protein